MHDEIAELRDALERLQTALDDVVVRGLRAAGPAELARLSALHDEFRGAGAAQLAERLQALLEALRADSRTAPGALLRTLTAVRLFDRCLTLEVAGQELAAALADADENSTAPVDTTEEC
jgi:hypothetical protein